VLGAYHHRPFTEVLHRPGADWARRGSLCAPGVLQTPASVDGCVY
jgi:hypothetical protein